MAQVKRGREQSKATPFQRKLRRNPGVALSACSFNKFRVERSHPDSGQLRVRRQANCNACNYTACGFYKLHE
jgi:hypothetical protein